MALTYGRSGLDEIEERRRIGAAIAASSQLAASQGISGFDKMESLAKQSRAESRQTGLDKQASEEMTLKRRDVDADRARQSVEDGQRDADRALDAPVLAQKRADAMAASDAMELKRKVDAEPATGSGLMGEQAFDPGFKASMDVKRAAHAKGVEAEDMARRKAEADIDADKALAEQRRRKPTGRAGPKPVDPQVAELRSLAIAKGKREAANDGKPKPRAMSESGVKYMAALDNQLSELDKLIAKKDKINVGPLDARINSAAQMLGLDDADTTTFFAEVSGVVDQLISDLSGANVPPAEWERLKQGLPSKSDNDVSYKVKLKSIRKRMQGLRGFLDDGFALSGRPTSAARSTPSAADVAEMDPADLDSLTEEQMEAILAAGGG